MSADRRRARILRSLACWCLLATPFTGTKAQVSPPAGWTSQASNGTIVLNSPATARGPRLALMLLPPVAPQGEPKAWFAKQALVLAQSTGRVLESTETMEKGGLFLRAVRIEDKRRQQLRIFLYGYPTTRGMSISLLLVPLGVADQDPQLEAANQYVQQLAGQRFEVNEDTLAAAGSAAAGPAYGASPGANPGIGGSATGTPGPGVTRNAQGQYVGEFGKSDTDLTYHAKGILPKERDVPLKGVYVFVGFAFGASYGGVGTTMTWGQKAVQQLLLLYENGVAAKVDLRGGNLAGKYQAEGFATLDVSDPTAVSGAPFGRWSEDEGAVHIRWNIGAPTELAKNGANLEGKGERWTPFKLADGALIEGTFVRKMEAGLRSQWIVLKKDGTFTGDGVNVTMGGSIVNPRFPERGGGRYEVHKGSLILYFGNGYTQAIACILDEAPTGEVKTVLLNGFPFERVR